MAGDVPSTIHCPPSTRTNLEAKMTGILQILFLIAAVAGSGYFGMWARRYDISGVEMWFPLGLLVSYAINPFAGLVVGAAIITITWALHPYGLHHLAISTASFGGTFYLAAYFFPIAQQNFLFQTMLVAAIFQIISNAFYILTKYPLSRIARFVIVNLFLCWLIFSRIGFILVQWLK